MRRSRLFLPDGRPKSSFVRYTVDGSHCCIPSDFFETRLIIRNTFKTVEANHRRAIAPSTFFSIIFFYVTQATKASRICSLGSSITGTRCSTACSPRLRCASISRVSFVGPFRLLFIVVCHKPWLSGFSDGLYISQVRFSSSESWSGSSASTTRWSVPWPLSGNSSLNSSSHLPRAKPCSIRVSLVDEKFPRSVKSKIKKKTL